MAKPTTPSSVERLAHDIGLSLRLERTRQEWSQRRLAAAAGLSHVHVCNVEKGQKLPSLGALQRLAGALGCGLRVELDGGDRP